MHKVGLVVDPDFGARLIDLARSFHVWVVGSPANSPVVERIRKEEPAPGDAIESGVTSFTAGGDESPEALCTRIASELDSHHGELAHDPPWSEIEVFGARLTPALRRVYAELGASSFEPTAEGFVCRRQRGPGWRDG